VLVGFGEEIVGEEERKKEESLGMILTRHINKLKHHFRRVEIARKSTFLVLFWVHFGVE
jgi:hypothetical protein